jgi:hypothetical protein
MFDARGLERGETKMASFDNKLLATVNILRLESSRIAFISGLFTFG